MEKFQIVCKWWWWQGWSWFAPTWIKKQNSEDHSWDI